jgi:hypothetical protein
MGGVCGPAPPTPPAASRATACAPTRCRSRSWASAPYRSCRRSRASRARCTESTEGQSPGGASRPRRARCPTTSPVRCGAVERAVVRGHRAPGKAERRHEEPAALVEHTRYSITWSARSSTDCGIVRPRALAVLRLITNSNFVGCSTGSSAGLAPLRILST